VKDLTSTDILHRRILVFELWTCRHIAPKRIVEILEKRDIRGATIKTVRRDISTLKEWLPEIIKLKENSSQVTAELLGKHQVTQQRLLNLAETADNSNAQVGALRASVDAINAEVDLRLKTGQISAVPQRFEVKSDVDVKGLIERAIPAIIENFMDAEAKQLHGEIRPADDKPDEDDAEGPDTAHPDP
jgi:uncharacterized protein (DUF3084 family)